METTKKKKGQKKMIALHVLLSVLNSDQLWQLSFFEEAFVDWIEWPEIWVGFVTIFLFFELQLFLVSGHFGVWDLSFLIKGIFSFLIGTNLVPAIHLFLVYKRNIRWEGTRQRHKGTCDNLMLLHSTKNSPVAVSWKRQLLANWIGEKTFQKVRLT